MELHALTSESEKRQLFIDELKQENIRLSASMKKIPGTLSSTGRRGVKKCQRGKKR
jgi:hypothetical protein